MSELREIEHSTLLECLRSKREPQKTTSQTNLSFVAHLLEIFGQRYAGQIQNQLSRQNRDRFEHVHRAYVEIQSRLSSEKEEVAYMGGEKLPFTREIIKQYKTLPSPDRFFESLKKRSYRILPFPQTILIHSVPDFRSLEAIEEIREKAFRLLMRQLSQSDLIEEKKSLLEEKKSPLRQKEVKWTAEEEVGVTSLYFSGVAFYYEGEPIYFSDLIRAWGNPTAMEGLLKKLTARHWVQEKQSPRINDFSNLPRKSFREFLVHCSIAVMQNNLRIQFSESLTKTFIEAFQQESIRSDLCFFTANLAQLYRMDLTDSARPSAHLLRSLQLFLFISQKCRVKQEDRAVLLDLIVHRDFKWEIKNLNGFHERFDPPITAEELATIKAKAEQITPEELAKIEAKAEQDKRAEITAAFPQAWDEFGNLLMKLSKGNVSFFTRENQDFSYAWPLFGFLWQRNISMQLFYPLAEDPHFEITLKILYRFCEANPELKNQEIKRFIETHFEILQVLKRGGIELRDVEGLFFDPPVKIQVSVLGIAAQNTGRLIDYMRPYSFLGNANYMSILRHHILHPSQARWVFELLKDAPALGIREVDDENFLCPILSISHKSLVPESPSQSIFCEPLEQNPLNLLQKVRAPALEKVKSLHKRFQFSNLQVFFLYLEIIRLLLAEKEEATIEPVAQFINEFENFSPALETKDVYFLFHYHPKTGVLSQLDEIVELRSEWAKSPQLTRFIIDQELLRSKDGQKGILKRLEDFADALAASCPDDQEQTSNNFRVSFLRSLLAAFFPPTQSLGDHFRITKLTATKGIRWGKPIWATHLGQFHSVKGESSLRMYFHWSIHQDRPVFFFSFFDIKKKIAFSKFLPLYVSLSELEDDEKRRPFFNFLAVLAQHIFNEETTNRMNPSQDVLEASTSWISCFLGLEEEINQYLKDPNLKIEHMNAIWDFMREVKCAFRMFFLYAIRARQPPQLGILAKNLGVFVSDQEIHIPDITETFLADLVKKECFSTPMEHPKSLGLDLKTEDEIELPIFYTAQTADQIVQAAADPSEKLDEIEKERDAHTLSPKDTEGIYMSFARGGIKIPLRYPPELLSNPEALRGYLYAHYYFLKTHCSYSVVSEPIFRQEDEKKEVG